MSTATVNGIGAAQCLLTVPLSGIPFADVELTEEATIPDRSVLIIGTLTMVCSPIWQGTYLGRTQARLAAGGAGWRKPVTPRGYGSPAGVILAQVIADAAAEVGELVGVVPASNVGPFFGRVAGPASQVFDRVPAGLNWWVDMQGLAQVAARPVTPSLTPVEAIDWDPWIRRLIVGCEDNGSIGPGSQLTLPSVGTVTINAARWSIANDRLRGELWTAA